MFMKGQLLTIVNRVQSFTVMTKSSVSDMDEFPVYAADGDNALFNFLISRADPNIVFVS